MDLHHSNAYQLIQNDIGMISIIRNHQSQCPSSPINSSGPSLPLKINFSNLPFWIIKSPNHKVNLKHSMPLEVVFILIQMRAEVTLKHCTRLPLLGLKSQPSPYAIVDCEGTHRNPMWDHRDVIQATKVTTPVRFYIYNSNPNGVDELLGYKQIEFEEMLTQTITETTLRLVNAQHQPLRSTLVLEHNNSKPDDVYLPLNQQSCLKLQLISLPHSSTLLCQYADQSFGLNTTLTTNTFPYRPQDDRVLLTLYTPTQVTPPQAAIMVRNVTQSTPFRLRFNGEKQEYWAYVAASMVPNGLLPPNYNTLNLAVQELTKNNTKQQKFKVKVTGPLNSAIIIGNQEAELYVENNANFLLEYYEEGTDIDHQQPACVFQLPINVLNWPKDARRTKHSFRHYNSFKHVQTVLNVRFQLFKSRPQSKSTPKLLPTRLQIDEESHVQLDQIRLSNCFLWQVIKGHRLKWVHVCQKGLITSFGDFILKEGQNDYIVPTKVTLKQGGKGILYLIDLDQVFTPDKNKEEDRSLNDSLILKVSIERGCEFKALTVDYDRSFLSYAKKASVVNICKKFNQMVSDDLLKPSIKSRTLGQLKSGKLRLINARVTGSTANRVELGVSIDGAQMYFRGLAGNYLLSRPWEVSVEEGRTTLDVKVDPVASPGPKSKKQYARQGLRVTLHQRLSSLVGSPSPHQTYLHEIKLDTQLKLQFIFEYSFKAPQPQKPLVNELVFFPSNLPIRFEMSSAWLGKAKGKWKFRVTRGEVTKESKSQHSSNSILWLSEQDLAQLGGEGDKGGYIFVSAYNQEDGLTVFNGHLLVEQLLGRGCYQLCLTHQKQETTKHVYLSLSLNHNLPPKLKQATLKFGRINLEGDAVGGILKTIFKYYLLVSLQGHTLSVLECVLKQGVLHVQGSVEIGKAGVQVQLFTSYKPLSRQLFDTSQKELIGTGRVSWLQLDKQGVISLKYLPGRDKQLKLTRNSLALSQQDTKLLLPYQLEEGKDKDNLQPVVRKLQSLPLQVLTDAILELQVLSFHPHHLPPHKLLTLTCPSLSLTIHSQTPLPVIQLASVAIPNMHLSLEATLTFKNNDQYETMTSRCSLNLKNYPLKTNASTPLTLPFQDHFTLRCKATVLYNMFTSAPEGTLQLKQLSFRGNSPTQLALSFINSNQQTVTIKESAALQFEHLDQVMKTVGLTDKFEMLMEKNGRKFKECVSLASLQIDKYGDNYVWQRLLMLGNDKAVVTFRLAYSPTKLTERKQNSLNYKLDSRQQLQMEYPVQHIAGHPQSHDTARPKRQKGTLVTAALPTQYAENTKQVRLITEGKEETTLELKPSMTEPNLYSCYSNQTHSVKRVELVGKGNRSHEAAPAVEYLGEREGVQKYMLGHNPKNVCNVTQQHCLLADTQEQQWQVRVVVHCACNQAQSRLLSLSNTPNDQVLTHQLGIAVKHSSQVQLARSLNQVGIREEGFVELVFGYDVSSDVVEFYLFVDNFWMDEWQPEPSSMLQDWMRLLPISYGKVNLSGLHEMGNIGCKLDPLPNSSVNLERALNNTIVRSDGIYCLSEIGFRRGKWAYLTISLTHLSEIVMKEGRQGGFTYCQVEVEDQSRQVIKSHTTQPRQIKQGVPVDFTRGTIDWLWVEEGPSDSHYNIKISATLVHAGEHIQLFEKRQDMTQMMSKRGRHTLHLTIKPNDANNLTEKTIQAAVSITNSSNPKPTVSLVEQAAQVNKVDALSFRDMTGMEFLGRLMHCQQLSHLHQCLEQVRESFIYTQEPQIDMLCGLLPYLSYAHDPETISLLTQILEIDLLKSQEVGVQLQERGATVDLYAMLKVIWEQKEVLPENIVRVDLKEYQESVNSAAKTATMGQIKSIIKQQAHIVFTPDDFLRPISSKNNRAILRLVTQLAPISPTISNHILSDLPQWIQRFGYVEDEDEFDLFVLLLRLMLAQKAQAAETLIKWVQILVSRQGSLCLLSEFWQMINDKASKAKMFTEVTEKYKGKLSQDPVDTCRGFKIMLHSIHKTKELHQQCSHGVGNLLPQIFANLQSSSTTLVVSSHLDLLSTILDLKLLPQADRSKTATLIADSLKTTKDNNLRLILKGYLSKFSKGKAQAASGEGISEEMALKVGFHKKYLITSD